MINAHKQSPTTLIQPSIQVMYETWLELEKSLTFGSLDPEPSDIKMLETEEKVQQIIKQQGQIMEEMEKTSARSLEQILMKLSIWRRDNVDIDPNDGFANRGDYVAYSAYCDLLSLANKWEWATAGDKTHLLHNSPS